MDQAHLTEHKAWCSTAVDDDGYHIGGQGKWGHCGPGCVIPPDPRPPNATAKETGKTTLLLTSILDKRLILNPKVIL